MTPKEHPTTLPQKQPLKPLPFPVETLRALALLVAITMQPVAEPLPKCEAVKFPPKPGEDDGIYGEGVARTQRMDF